MVWCPGLAGTSVTAFLRAIPVIPPFNAATVFLAAFVEEFDNAAEKINRAFQFRKTVWASLFFC